MLDGLLLLGWHRASASRRALVAAVPASDLLIRASAGTPVWGGGVLADARGAW